MWIQLTNGTDHITQWNLDSARDYNWNHVQEKKYYIHF